MPLDWKEVADRARAFSNDWQHVEREEADAKSFWDEFFEVFGIKRRKVATFEKRVKKISGKEGYFDLLWKGTLLIEHKSHGKDLGKAFKQAKDYFPGLQADEEPRYILLCDFWQFELHDPDEDAIHRFTLPELDHHLRLFYFIAGYRKQTIRTEEAVNRVAVDALGELHDALKKDGYSGHDLEVFLVRLLFCLLADDTGIFQPKDSFHDLIEFHTHEDGSNVGAVLDTLFVTLNKDTLQRQPTSAYVVIPRHSSETRRYIPMGFCKPAHILSDSCTSVPNATLYHFGVLMSAMHMAWVKTVCGRIKSDYRYSNNIVYNNFPWPDFTETPKHKMPLALMQQAQEAIETAAQSVLDARALEAGATLADLYNPPMPAALLKAHRALDAAVDAAYALNGGKKSWKTDAERVAFLFNRHQTLSNLHGDT